MILIDEPAWPAHGTLWGHLVSDASLEELHAFARRQGLPDRGFDHDHYDYPADRRDALIEAGARLVPSTDLLRRLVAGGLRVRTVDRTPRRSVALHRVRSAWAALWSGGAEDLGADLIARWSEPHRRYHDIRHLASCVDALATLGCEDRLVHLAAWFHDAVHTGTAGADEEESARLAEERLPEFLPPTDVAEVARLVRVTAHHDPSPGDRRGAWLSDADLSILGAVRGRYQVYARDVRWEYAHVPDDAFRSGRAAVLKGLLDHEALYRTPEATTLWDERARANLHAELDGLRDPGRGASEGR